MAQAQKVWLEPETVTEPLVLQPRPRRRSPGIQVPWVRLVIPVLAVACSVGIGMVFISAYARIAEAQTRHQALRQEYAQLNRECVELNLELARLASQPRLAKVAEIQGLELPDANRVHYLRVTHGVPPSLAAPPAPPQASSWLARSGHRVTVALGTAWQLMGGGPEVQAYAHE